MSSRKHPLTVGEYYHVYNRGVEKRDIFLERKDVFRFVKCMDVFNTLEPVGSLYRVQNLRGLASQVASRPKLVDITCFCLMPNHFHFLLRQSAENGISLFMHRLSTAHAMYFNEKYERSGGLFQGKFKAIHIDSNEYLLHSSVYINFNDQVHTKWDREQTGLSYSSWLEYCGETKASRCEKSVILDQFEDLDDYKKYAQNALREIRRKREEEASAYQVWKM